MKKGLWVDIKWKGFTRMGRAWYKNPKCPFRKNSPLEKLAAETSKANEQMNERIGIC